MDRNKSGQMEDSGNLGRVIFISFVAAIGGFLFGFDSGVINGTVDALQLAFDSDAVGTGFNVASMLLGCAVGRSEEHTSELQSRGHLVCRLLLEKKKTKKVNKTTYTTIIHFRSDMLLYNY